MKIGIDARLYGLEHAGIGRYIINLVDRVINDQSHTWVLFIHPKYASHFNQPNVLVEPTSIRHYSLDEQLKLPVLFAKHNLDLLHVPHFNVPLFYNKPFVVTIHDILWSQVKGGSVTTLSPVKYYLKHLGYKAIMSHALRASQKIIVPSNYVKSDILKSFTFVSPEKIIVTYEGVGDE